MKKLMLIIPLLLSGCGINHGLDIDITGTDLKTPYGSGIGTKRHNRWRYG